MGYVISWDLRISFNNQNQNEKWIFFYYFLTSLSMREWQATGNQQATNIQPDSVVIYHSIRTIDAFRLIYT